MASKIQVEWTFVALSERLEILAYWAETNGNLLYAKKLEKLFQQLDVQLSTFPYTGPVFKRNLKVRYLVIENYKIFYSITKTKISIMHIWDVRRNPKEFNM